MGGYEEEEIVVAATETEALSSDEDPLLDPLQSGFTWYKPAHSLEKVHKTGGHTWTISGHDMQVLTSTVPPGSEFITEVGSFIFMHPGMTTSVELTLCGPSGCGEGFGRIMGGESCAKVYLKNGTSEEGYVGVTPNYPAKIVPVKFGVNIPSGGSLIAQGGSYMAEIGGVHVGFDLDCGIRTCCCAGLGACRQKISGSDDSIAFLSAGGTIIYRSLADGETITVDSRSILAYDETAELGIALNGRLCTCFCGGEGCFSTTLTGPGQVWLQSMNFSKFQAAVQVTIQEDEMDRGVDVSSVA